MRYAIRLVLLAAGYAVVTMALGWWAIPVAAAIWGASSFGTRFTWLTSALSAALAWAVLLIVTATQGPVAQLAQTLGEIFAMPGFAMVVLTLVFPATLAGSATELAASLRSYLHDQSNFPQGRGIQVREKSSTHKGS
jgi:hypothetical protein